jgi:cytoskeleton protein RodZ
VESLGARLKREREQRKITLDEISLSTKIGTRFLIAIEEEQFDQLPGGIFNKGFVRAYARSVGVDENQAVAEYESVTAPKLPEIPPDSPGSGHAAPAAPASTAPILAFPDEDSGNGASRVPWEWFAVALLIVAFGIALWGFYSREKSAKPRSLSSAPGDNFATTIPVPKAPAQPESPAPAASVAPAAESDSSVSQPVSAAPAMTAQTQAPVSAPPVSTASGSVPNPGAFLVQIKARQDSWVTITADGRQIMQGTLNASAEKSIGARDMIVIKTGNAGALDISFNGNKLPPPGALNQVKTITIDPNGMRL